VFVEPVDCEFLLQLTSEIAVMMQMQAISHFLFIIDARPSS
jgi:hypothetical protein